MMLRLVGCLLTALLALISNEIVYASPSRGPIIGIFAQPAAQSAEYIAASYVKWVEMAGGRVVPIPYTAPKEYLKSLISQLNGFLFPGGAATVNDQAKYIYKLALELNDQGIHFPVWGTCLGFEWLLDITAEDDKAIQGGFDSMNISLPLSFTEAASKSRLYGEATKELLTWLAEKSLTMNNHMQGMSPERFAQYTKLTEFYTVLSTNQDRNGRTFISSIEAKDYPIYAIQFHPEKNSFEYGVYPDGTPYEVVDHSYEGIQLGQYFANFFINEARKNSQQFKDPKVEHASLIYNYQTSTITSPSFVESYIFKHQTQINYWRIE